MKNREQNYIKPFYNANIEYILPDQKRKSGYYLKHDHSEECYDLKNIISRNEHKTIRDRDKFIEECENIMNKSSIYNRNLFKTEFKNLYNKNKYDFPINNNLISKIITKWKNSSLKMNKSIIFTDKYDHNNNLIFRDYRNITIYSTNKNSNIAVEYIIWGNNENINRMRISKHYYIDATFHHQEEFKQLLIIMYKDLLTNLNIPGLYILMNGKSETHYDLVFESILDIITHKNFYNLDLLSIITDTENALINTIKNYFPNTRRIGCYYHYCQDIVRNIKLYGLYKKEQKKISNKVIFQLSEIPLIYKDDI